MDREIATRSRWVRMYLETGDVGSETSGCPETETDRKNGQNVGVLVSLARNTAPFARDTSGTIFLPKHDTTGWGSRAVAQGFAQDSAQRITSVRLVGESADGRCLLASIFELQHC
jgi:hypothetical protein